MKEERNPMPMDIPDFVREAEEAMAMARGETFGQSLAEVTIKNLPDGFRELTEEEIKQLELFPIFDE